MTLPKGRLNFWGYILLPLSWPLALIYGGVIRLRHLLYNKGILPTRNFDLPIICVGNLSTGGTGKTPTVLYLLDLLGDQKVATLSRGYKRKTKGFLIANNDTGPADLGDEPHLFHQQFPEAIVSVGEDRCAAVDQLMHLPDPPEVIILDDGFQHRRLRPGFSIILTDYSRLFSRDYLLPTGQLRDIRKAAKRAQMIVVTKCPTDLATADKEKLTNELCKYGPKIVLFSYIHYQKPLSLTSGSVADLSGPVHILLLHGIARPKSLREYVRQLDPDFKEIAYEDHHDYTTADIQNIKNAFRQLPEGRRMVLTTEKDSVKLRQFDHLTAALPIYILPIKLDFLFQGEGIFNEQILAFTHNYKH